MIWLQPAKPYILFGVSILCIPCIFTVITSMGCFRAADSAREKILLQILVALLGRSVIWVVMLGPTVSTYVFDYQSRNWTSGIVLSLHFYTVLVTAFSLLALGHYLNQKLKATSELRVKPPMITYKLFVWGLPIIIVAAWAGVEPQFVDTGGWSSYMQSRAFWIILFPLVSSFVVNLIYLLNMLWVLLKATCLDHHMHEQGRISGARSDIIIVFLVLGMNQLILPYFILHEDEVQHYEFFHVGLQSIQAILVPLLFYCLSSDRREGRDVEMSSQSLQSANGKDVERISLSLQHTYRSSSA